MMSDDPGGGTCEECGTRLYQAGDTAPAGAYLRVDDGSFHRVILPSAGPLPASFDGHVARYRAAAAPCVCERQHAAPNLPARPDLHTSAPLAESAAG